MLDVSLASELLANCPQFLHSDFCTENSQVSLPGSISGQHRACTAAPGEEWVGDGDTEGMPMCYCDIHSDAEAALVESSVAGSSGMQADAAGASRGGPCGPTSVSTSLPPPSAPQPPAAVQPLSVQRQDDW